MKTKRKLLTIVLHVTAWLLLLAGPWGSAFYQVVSDSAVIWLSVLFLAVLVAGFYLNYYVLIPKFLFKKKFATYVLSVVVMLGLIFLINWSFYGTKKIERRDNRMQIVIRENRIDNTVEHRQPPMPGERPLKPEMRPTPPPFIFTPLFVPIGIFMLLIFGIAIRTTAEWFNEDRKNRKISEEQLKTELAFLKNQISPHFFFNTLNNIYALTESEPEKAKEITYKLSKLMRYLLYESDKNRSVTLAMEISFLQNYIDLMKVRLTDKISVTTDFEKEFDKIQIPPLLFISFVENAFKHGISLNQESFVDISLKNIAGKVVFVIKNSIPDVLSHEKGRGGLGLVNVKRRLELLFEKDVYSLRIDVAKNIFTVELIIPANDN